MQWEDLEKIERREDLQSDLSDGTKLSKDFIHLFRRNVERQISDVEDPAKQVNVFAPMAFLH